MIDCSNAEVRDQLPDFVHGQSGGRAHADVAAHVAACTACTAEVELLRELRGALRAGPTVDVARIVAMLPAPGTGEWRPERIARNWRSFDWRVAAAITALVIGGGSAALLSGVGREGDDRAPRVVQHTPPPDTGTAVLRVAAGPSIDAYVDDATAGELETLLADLDAFDGLPAGEPESALTAASDPGVDG